MTVRCKFKCRSKTAFDDGQANVHLEVVTDGSDENKKFFKYTPNGYFDLNTINSEAAQTFEVGKEYFVDITLAE